MADTIDIVIVENNDSITIDVTESEDNAVIIKGDKGDTGAQGVQGVQGVQGEKGDPGANPFSTFDPTLSNQICIGITVADSFTITGSNNLVIRQTVSNGTITVSTATAGNILIGCKTKTDIVDSGNVAQIIGCSNI
jgi:hypothetical protein